MGRVTLQISFDTDEPDWDRHVTYAVMSILAVAAPYMAENVSIVEVED